MEVIRTVHWIDRGAGRAFSGLRQSPAWYFVTSVGIFAVGLTILLFVSVASETSGHRRLFASTRQEAFSGRHELAKTHDWSVQDRWRVAHFFVPHQPARTHRDIRLDSRLLSSRSTSVRRDSLASTVRSATQLQSDADIGVRLEMSRPRRAQLENRLAAATVHDLGEDPAELATSRLRGREPGLLVEAAWDFGSDCDRYEYVSVPERRPIPRRPIAMTVPEPEPEPIRRTEPLIRPDLAFEMKLELKKARHNDVAGAFPPNSHLVTIRDRSVFPDDDSLYSSHRNSNGDVLWQRFEQARNGSAARVIPYFGIGNLDLVSYEREGADEYDPNLPATAEVALRLEIDAPHRVTGGEQHRSRLIVSNEGERTVPRIEVREDLTHLRTVIAADPEAVGEGDADPESGAQGQRLLREIPGLLPGHERELALTWLLEGGRRQFHRAQVTAHAEVSAFADVVRPVAHQQLPSIPPEIPFETHPSLACDVQHLDRVMTGDEVEFEIAVHNTGDTALHRVKVLVEIPEELSHRDGRKFVFEAGDLPVRGSNRTVLKMSAVRAGEAANILRVNADERVAATGRSVVLVVDRQKMRETVPPVPVQVGTKPVTPSRPASQPTPVVQAAPGECSCRQPAVPFPWYGDFSQ